MSILRRTKLLWDGAQSLDGETHTKRLLKSHLINACRNLAGSNSSIPLERFTESQMCTRCATHWQENEFHTKLRPQGIQITTSKARKLIEKLKLQESGQRGLLTKNQKKRAKWLLKRAESRLEIHCEFCHHKTIIALDKTNRKKKKPKKQLEELDSVITTKIKKKKKKQIDKTAGLKIPKLKSNENEKINKPVKLVKKAQNIQESTKTTQQSTTKAVNKKPKNNTKTNTKPVQSKAQKQNSLLQLAALLKSQDNAKSPTSHKDSKNRLESLLK